MDDMAAGREQLASAVRDGRADVDSVAHVVGASAATRGVPLHEVIDLVERAHDGDPSHPTVRAAVLAWAEARSLHAHDVGCEDALTTLTGVPHLRSRLGDVLREARREDCRPADLHALVVVEVLRDPLGNDLEGALRELEVAEALRTVFPGEETIARLTQQRFAVLARRDRTDRTTLALLGMLLARTAAAPPAPRVWVEELPSDASDLAHLLGALTA